MSSKILVANRSEIAVRIINECKKLGIKTVAICSDIERGALHMRIADEGYCIGSAPPNNSYMNMEAIVNAAIVTKASMVHPGYGFLSENKAFAKLCEQHDISFVGPASSVLTQVSDKYSAKQIAVSQRVPVLTGFLAENANDALMWINEIGYPVMIKMSNGGGGVGITSVFCDEEVKKVFEMFQTSKKGKLFIEKFIERARHIEVQIMADKYGNIVTIGSRECSIQSNNKKVLEECPAHCLSDRLLNNLYACSLKMAKAVNFVGVGTLEFLVDEFENYYFMEMNARIQVEHGITEMISGLNLVQWQIRIALGDKIPFTQDDIILNGHALECRINVESYGRLGGWRLESSEARFDHALTDGISFTPYYDSMLGKLISHGRTRSEAIGKMRGYLDGLHIMGIETNIEQHKNILNSDCFVNGIYFTNFLSNKEEQRSVELEEPLLAGSGSSAVDKSKSFSWLRDSFETLFKNKEVYTRTGHKVHA